MIQSRARHHDVAADGDSASLTIEDDGDRRTVRLEGAWVTERLEDLAPRLLEAARDVKKFLVIDLGAVSRLDANAAGIIAGACSEAGHRGAETRVEGLTPEHRTLMEMVSRAFREPPPEPKRPSALVVVLERVGRAALAGGSEARDLLGFLGRVTLAVISLVRRPGELRVRATVNQMERTGLNAMPIVGLLSFLIGIVIAYQGADQLARFGAEIFTVNIVGVTILREMGVLITSIVVAGRSGSAFAAEIGSMRVNQEIDAMETLGLDPVRVLVVPRVLGMVVVLPLLTFYADVLGLAGGAVMAALTLDISIASFLAQLRSEVGLTAFWVGMVKAPLFAVVIALVGCFQGMMVAKNAESVGFRTTRAVVQAIFLIIVFDALLSIFFSLIGV